MKTYTQYCSFVFVILILMFSQGRAQFNQQGGKLVGLGAVGPTQQGYSVSVSADGNTAIVGGNGDNSFAGAAWVYTRSDGIWTQQGSKLVGTGASGSAYQGVSVSLSGDGNTAIVGGYGDSSYIGAAWVYTRSGGIWTQQGSKLVGTGAVGAAYQGASVSLSADGNTAIVGGYGDNSFAGAAWLFTRTGGIWMQQGSKLVGTGAVGAATQGYSVSLSADGNTAIAGGLNDSGDVGAVWVFTRNGGVWTQFGNKLVGTGAVGSAQQGSSVSISGDASTIIVGGPNDNFGVGIPPVGAGAAWVYIKVHSLIGNNYGYVQQGSKLVGTAANKASQGASVSLSADGNTAIVGGPADNYNEGSLTYGGSAWVFTRSNDVWAPQGNKFVGTGAVNGPRQGTSVSLSADGNTTIVGGYEDNSYIGAAWVYANVGSPVIASISDIPNDQGGRVGIEWNKSPYDNSLSNPQVNSYSIWRALPGSSASPSTASPTVSTINSAGKKIKQFTINGVDSYWEWIADQPSLQLLNYGYTAQTLSDSISPTSNGMTQFFVTAQTADQNVFYKSVVDSGYSVDNIPPLAPQNLVLNTQSYPWVLHWNPNTEPDLGRYSVYKSANPITNPSLLQPFAYIADTFFVDNAPSQKVYYVVCAEDIHNNFSPPSNQVTYGVTGVIENGKGIPTSYALAQNYPNPFNPTTIINYALPKQAFVRLTIYNTLGQEVATLVNEMQDAGNKSVEFDANNFPSGMYFYKVNAGTFTQVKKMILLK